jgi:hypothetical protein
VAALGPRLLAGGVDCLGLDDPAARAALDRALRRAAPGVPGLGVFVSPDEPDEPVESAPADVEADVEADAEDDADDIDRFFAAVVRGASGGPRGGAD